MPASNHNAFVPKSWSFDASPELRPSASSTRSPPPAAQPRPKIAASSTFGVMTSTAAHRSSQNSTRHRPAERAPDDDRITGSSTTFGSFLASIKPATAAATSTEPSIPTRTAAISRSSAKAASVRETSSASTGWTPKNALCRLDGQRRNAGYGEASLAPPQS